MSLADLAFTKLGAKLARPAWMSTASVQLMFPRVFHNDAVRASLNTVPSADYSVLYSSDHAGTGYAGRVDFDDIEGTWTDAGNYVLTDINGGETWHPIYDAANNRILVYGHVNASAGHTYSSQHTKVWSTTTLANGGFTDLGSVMAYGVHTGYAQALKRGANYELLHVFCAGEHIVFGRSTSADGLTYSHDRLWPIAAHHVAGTGHALGGSPYLFEYPEASGEWYWLTNRCTRPRLTGYPGNILACVAVPIDIDTLRPTGGYITLVEPGTDTDPDINIKNDFAHVIIGGTLYILYVGVDSDGDQSICVAKAEVGTSTQASLLYPVRSTGEVERHDAETVEVAWDAVNEDLPASLTKVLISGTDNSAHSDGNYYELKTGSGSTQDIYIRTTDTFLPSENETLELSVTMTLAEVGVSDLGIEIGFLDMLPFGTRDGATMYWSPVSGREGGSTFAFKNEVGVETDTTYSIPYLENTTNNGKAIRATLHTLTCRIHDYGKRITVFLDGNVVWTQDISATATYGTGVFGFIRIQSRNTFPEVYARIHSLTVKSYVIAPPANLSASHGGSGVTITWTDPAGSDLSQVHIYRSETQGSGHTLLDSVAIGEESYLDETADPGTTYYYVLTAEDGSEVESANSSEATASPGGGGGGSSGGRAAKRGHYNLLGLLG